MQELTLSKKIVWISSGVFDNIFMKNGAIPDDFQSRPKYHPDIPDDFIFKNFLPSICYHSTYYR